jgi:predicted O-methyltransferase YrrM
MLDTLKGAIKTLFALVSGPADTRNLAVLEPSRIAAFFDSPAIDEQWKASAAQLANVCQIEDMKTGGVNPGDRRALFYIVKALRPTSILEIGSHVGASTVHIAAAMAPGSRFTTVDIQEVNDRPGAYWRVAGLPLSPRQMVSKLNKNLDVSFVTSDSVAFLTETDLRFDFIFLDGDHSKETVLKEILKSLTVLNKNGVILLHDYFPGRKPLWSDGSVDAGPFEATEELRKRGAGLKVVPFGTLPWATKLGSHITSLAIVVRDSAILRRALQQRWPCQPPVCCTPKPDCGAF